MSPFRSCLVLACCLLVLASGCPPNQPKPPFNATGRYTGVWSGTSNETEPQHVENCPLTLKLRHDPAANWPADHTVTGKAIIDYSCINLPDWVEQPAPSRIQVSGLIDNDGRLTLVSGGCTTALCVVLTLTGQCTDNDGDGYADTYSGTWAFRILLAGVEPFGLDGVFDVAVAP